MISITKEIIKLKKKAALNKYWRYRNKKYLKQYEAKRYPKRKKYLLKLNKKSQRFNRALTGKVIRDGYLYIACPFHPNCTKAGQILFHRIIIMENKIGRYLKKEEIVHHIDENKLNNKIENLELIDSINSHSFIHDKIRNKDIKGRYISGCDAVP